MYNQTLCSVYILIPQLRKKSVIYFTALINLFMRIFKKKYKKEPLEKLTLIGRHTREVRHLVDSFSKKDLCIGM